MAKKKSEKTPDPDPIDLHLDTVVIDETIPKGKAAKGKNTVITTSDLKRSAPIKAAKSYKPGEDQIIVSGGDLKPRKYKDVKG